MKGLVGTSHDTALGSLTCNRRIPCQRFEDEVVGVLFCREKYFRAISTKKIKCIFYVFKTMHIG